MQEIKVLSTYRLSLKSKILESAMSAFLERGIKSVKMDDIAKGLNISKRTLYEIYDNKEILLYECLKKAKTKSELDMMEMMSEKNNVMDIILHIYKVRIEQFQKVCPQFYADLEKYPMVLAFLNEQRERDRVSQRKFIQRGITEGYFRKDIDLDIILSMFEAIGEYVRGHHLYEKFPIESIFTNMLFVSLRGICTQKGIDVIEHFLKNE